MPERERAGHEGFVGGAARADIQGMRALAVLLVALSHAGTPLLAGGFVGVDVFFVISGFLITGLLLRRSAETGKFSFVEFYARRAVRILPAAVLVLVVTDLAARRLLPVVQAEETIHDSVWALFSVANIHFADVGTDYFAQDQPPSALQHYWSLSVEEQYYLVWPLVLAVALFGLRMVARRGSALGPLPAHRAGLVLAPLVVASLTWSILLTSGAPTGAYFSSLARAWELGLGALIAIGSGPLARLPLRIRMALGYGGVAAILVAAIGFTDQTPFPGFAALVPVLGAGAMIVAGLPDRRGANRAVGAQPLRYIGDVSYSFYLWHWPVLVLAASWWGTELSIAVNLGLLVGAFGLAVVTYHFFENPIRHGRLVLPDWDGLILSWAVGSCAVFLTVALASASLTAQVGAAEAAQVVPVLSSSRVTPVTAIKADQPPGFVRDSVAAARAGSEIPDETAPPLDVAEVDWSGLGACSGFDRSVSEIKPCTIGARGGSRSMVLFGDSHAEMWSPAFDVIGEKTDTSVHPFTKPGCGLVVQYLDLPGCGEWWSWARHKIRALHPDVIVIVVHATDSGATWSAGMVELISTFRPMTSRIVVLGDSPELAEPAPECLRSRGATQGSCASPPNPAVGEVNAEGPTLLHADFVATSQWFCAGGVCPAMMGNVVVYMDTNHITATYAEQLAPLLRQQLARGSGVDWPTVADGAAEGCDRARRADTCPADIVPTAGGLRARRGSDGAGESSPPRLAAADQSGLLGPATTDLHHPMGSTVGPGSGPLIHDVGVGGGMPESQP